ncbi:MAG: tail-specific protease [Planctomycetota bacterium]|nr:carboxy terminal-processing peptidase [Planctomycetales bacterium]RLT03059.1 MAG: tail-specific protease [Planctomycetota bacterium]
MVTLRTVSRCTLLLAGVILVPESLTAADKIVLTAEDGKTAQIVAAMVSSRHINHPEVNDALSEKLLTRYLEIWDPQKLYLLQSDIDEFSAEKTALDDKLLKGDVQFAADVFERFRSRMDTRAPKLDALIDMEYDFTVDEDLIRDAKEIAWAANEEELDERWRKRIKFDLLMLKMDDTDLAEARKRLHTRYHTNQVFLDQTEAHEVLELFLSSMTHCLDPHSTYMSPQTLEDFRIDMELKLDGIGARLKYDDGYTLVEEVIQGGAAATDGRLQKGDKIIGVSFDASDNFVDVIEMKLTKVVDMIRGKKGTKVKLKVLKPKEANEEETAGIERRTQIYELTRTEVKITEDEVKGKILESADWIDGRQTKVGILRIPAFYRDFRGATQGGNFKSTARDVKVVLEEFNKQDVQVLIVDLRWNGGGALQEAIEVSGLFIPKGSVVQVKEPDTGVQAFDDEDPEMYWRRPMVVVCNRFSASASEIFAGAIKDYRRGIVIGDRTTHGKGTVQNVVDVADRRSLFSTQDHGALKLTISKFYRVNGDSTQTKGVTSDVVLPSLLNVREIGEDSLDNALEFDRIERANYSPFSAQVTDAILSQLQQTSETRLSVDKDFMQINRLIEKYLERKNDKTISLNESVLRAEEEELKQEKKEEEEAVKQANGGEKKDIFPEDFYNKELVNISIDYLELLRSLQTTKAAK